MRLRHVQSKQVLGKWKVGRVRGVRRAAWRENNMRPESMSPTGVGKTGSEMSLPEVASMHTWEMDKLGNLVWRPNS